jgi:hypothetical protein
VNRRDVLAEAERSVVAQKWMRITVTALNVLSTLASLGMLLIGAHLVRVGLPLAKYGDYTPVVLGLVLVAAFSASLTITVVASVKLSDQSRRPAGIGTGVRPIRSR